MITLGDSMLLGRRPILDTIVVGRRVLFVAQHLVDVGRGDELEGRRLAEQRRWNRISLISSIESIDQIIESNQLYRLIESNRYTPQRRTSQSRGSD